MSLKSLANTRSRKRCLILWYYLLTRATRWRCVPNRVGPAFLFFLLLVVILTAILCVTGGGVVFRKEYCNNVNRLMFNHDIFPTDSAKQMESISNVSPTTKTTQSHDRPTEYNYATVKLSETQQNAAFFNKSCYYFHGPVNNSNTVDYWFLKPLPHPEISELSSKYSKFPKILHRLWKNATVPKKWIDGETTCLAINTDYLYCHWTDQELVDFVRRMYPSFLHTYTSYPYAIERADAARFLLLYHYGGAYLDLDITCRISFTWVLTKQSPDGSTHSPNGSRSTTPRPHGSTSTPSVKFNMADQYDVILAEAQPTGVVGDFFISKPRQPFIREVLSGLCLARHSYIFPYVTVMLSTGPWYLSIVFWSYPKNIISEDSNETRISRIKVIPAIEYNGQMFGHMEGASWQSWDGRFIWWLTKFWSDNFWSIVFLVSINIVVFTFLVKRFQQLRKICHVRR